MKRTYTTLATAVCLLFCASTAFAQLQVTANNNANALLSSIIGQGVTISNITINCPNGAAGTFSGGGGTNLGLNSGMILSTGYAANAVGPNDYQYVDRRHGVNFADPDLTQIDPQARFDPCIIEFDIIPTCGTLSIQYIFASEEYPDYVNSQFNDVFGFFITGPNPSGGTYNARNIAVVPNTSTPISVNTINANTNSSYFVRNYYSPCIGFPPIIPYPVTCTNPYYIEYNGFTVPLVASVSVTPCSTYRMKLAIADTRDDWYDSAVFFAGSGINGGGLFCQGATNLTYTFNTNLTCTDPNNGTATIFPTGGTPPYTYLWSNGQTTQTATGLSAGSYTVTITDNGCTTVSTSSGEIILSTVGPTITFTQNNIPCSGGTTGSAMVNISGGTAPFTIAWSNAVNTANNPNLVAGTYNVTVTDNIGCLAIGSVTITQASTLTATATSTPSACGSAGTGTVSVTATGGTAPYTYTWSNGPTTQNQSNLAAGTYSVTVRDNVGCTYVASTTVTTPNSFTLTLVGSAGNCTQPNSASIDLTATGGTAPFTYAWSNAANTEDIANVVAGTYTVTVTDGSGCVQIGTATVTVPAPVVLTIANTPPSCAGGNNGTATVTATSGTAPFTYAWSNGGNTATVGTLAAGPYTVTVTSAEGCTATASTTLVAPAAVLVSITSNNPTCPTLNNGNATAAATGGTGPYSYAWSTGGTGATINNLVAATPYTVTATDANGCTVAATATLTAVPTVSVVVTTTDELCNNANSGTATVVISGGTAPYNPIWSNGFNGTNPTNLAPGPYHVTVTDGSGCTATASGTVSPSSLPTVSITATNPTCNGSNNGSVQAVGNFATYTWGHGATTNPSTGLAQGNYNVTVTDAGGCTATASATLTEPIALTLALTPTQVNCNTPSSGGVTSAAGGGVAPYTYLWSNGAATASLSNLSPGNYAVTVTDANGCTITDGVSLAAPNPPTLSLNVIPVNCTGPNTASIDAVVTGGTAPIAYNWNTGSNAPNLANIGAGTYNVTISDASGCTATQSTNISAIPSIHITVDTVNPSCFGSIDGRIDVFGAYTTFAWSHGDVNMPTTGLGAGSYTVTVNDNNGCSTSRTFVLTEPTALQLNIAATAIACTDPNSGALQANVSGGTTPYQYIWSNAATTAGLPGLANGTYTVAVTDANGCTVTATETLTPNPALSVSLGNDVTLCPGDSVVFNLDTIAAPILWHDGSTANSYTATSAELVSVTVDYPNGCQGRDGVTVSVSDEVVLYPINDTTLCETETVRFTIGPSGFTYEWSNGTFGPDIVIGDSGVYVVTATSGCNVVQDTIVVQFEKCNCEVFMPNAFSPNGDGVNDQFKAYAECSEVAGFRLEVFNRWGELVYTSTDFEDWWDGTSKGAFCTPGIYIWHVSFVQAVNGRNYEQTKKGSVVLLK